MAHEIVEREPHDLTLLRAGDGFNGVTERAPLPCFHFDEHDGWPIARDDVNFSSTPAIPPRNNSVPETLQFTTREIFADFSESNASACHGAHASARGRPGSTATHVFVFSTSVSAASKIRIAASASARVSTRGGENRMAFVPAPSKSRPRANAALTTP